MARSLADTWATGGRRDLDQCIKAAGEGEGECYSIELDKEKELDRIQLEKEKERDRIQLQREKALIRIELEKKKFWRQMLEGYDELEAELRQRHSRYMTLWPMYGSWDLHAETAYNTVLKSLAG